MSGTALPPEPGNGCQPEMIEDEWGLHGPNQVIDGYEAKQRCLHRHGTTNKSGVSRDFGSVNSTNKGL